MYLNKLIGEKECSYKLKYYEKTDISINGLPYR